MHSLGYLDPGSGSMIASVIAAGFAGIAVMFKTTGRRMFSVFSPKRRKAANEAANEAGPTQPES